MSVDLLYILILLLAFLFINEHFISKGLREELLRTSFMKDVAVSIGDEAMNEVYKLSKELQRLQEQLNNDEHTDQEEDSKIMGT